MKKFLALFLAIIMVMTLVPLAALAQEDGEEDAGAIGGEQIEETSAAAGTENDDEEDDEEEGEPIDNTNTQAPPSEDPDEEELLKELERLHKQLMVWAAADKVAEYAFEKVEDLYREMRKTYTASASSVKAEILYFNELFKLYEDILASQVDTRNDFKAANDQYEAALAVFYAAQDKYRLDEQAYLNAAEAYKLLQESGASYETLLAEYNRIENMRLALVRDFNAINAEATRLEDVMKSLEKMIDKFEKATIDENGMTLTQAMEEIEKYFNKISGEKEDLDALFTRLALVYGGAKILQGSWEAVVAQANTIINDINTKVGIVNDMREAEYKEWIEGGYDVKWTAFWDDFFKADTENKLLKDRVLTKITELPTDEEGNPIITQDLIDAVLEALEELTSESAAFESAKGAYKELTDLMDLIAAELEKLEEGQKVDSTMLAGWLEQLGTTYELIKAKLKASGIPFEEMEGYGLLEEMCETLIALIEQERWNEYLTYLKDFHPDKVLIGGRTVESGVKLINLRLTITKTITVGTGPRAPKYDLKYGYIWHVKPGNDNVEKVEWDKLHEDTSNRFLLGINDPASLPQKHKIPLYKSEDDYKTGKQSGSVEFDKAKPDEKVKIGNVDYQAYDYKMTLYNAAGDYAGSITPFWIPYKNAVKVGDKWVFEWHDADWLEFTPHVPIDGAYVAPDGDAKKRAPGGQAAIITLKPGTSITFAFCACADMYHASVFTNPTDKDMTWIIPFHYHDGNQETNRKVEGRQKTGITINDFDQEIKYELLKDLIMGDFGNFNAPDKHMWAPEFLTGIECILSADDLRRLPKGLSFSATLEWITLNIEGGVELAIRIVELVLSAPELPETPPTDPPVIPETPPTDTPPTPNDNYTPPMFNPPFEIPTVTTPEDMPVPLAEITDIEDMPVPLAELPEEVGTDDEEIVDVEDMEVPLADMPQTGNGANPLIFLILSALGTALIGFFTWRKSKATN